MNLNKLNSVQDLNALREMSLAALENGATRVVVCGGTGCTSNGSLLVLEALRSELAERNIPIRADLLDEDASQAVSCGFGGCAGFCEGGPVVRILPSNFFYVKVQPEDVTDIIEQTLLNGRPVERLLFKDRNSGERFAVRDELPFYKDQINIVLADCGVIEPGDIRHYIAHEGYRALAESVFGMTAEAVIEEVIQSGLRGRGGGGFPTGRKWALTQKVKSAKKYVICNADEGDPGAFMDRSILEGNPHSVIEGMMIAGYAVGADEGYIYCRAEYPLAVQRLKVAINQAEESNLLGDNILGGSFSFRIKIKEGAGAFVCGEETALIASIEGRRGMPSPKPPFPAQSGLYGMPTVVNNVETFANVPNIIRNGSEWFRTFGVPTSPGTKVFALTGSVVNTGLIEVPMGTTLSDIVFKIGGGIRGGREFKTVQIGGPSGGCLTADHLGLPLDFDSLKAAGAMVGSGGLVVMDDSTCMVEVARFFMQFTQNESCGKCVLCREGTKQMLGILEKITTGRGTAEDVILLEELALAVRDGSLCGLGKTAPNPVLSTLKYFRDEYLAHVVDGVCPSGACQAFRNYRISAEKCKGCTLCAKKCPVGAITGEVKQVHAIDQDACVKCGACYDACRLNAIEI